jgi:hypothetical protein
MDFLIPALYKITSEKKAEDDPSKKPPSEWVEKITNKIRKGNSGYSEERVRETMGDIWYNNLTAAKRKEIRERYGKKYGSA